MLTLVILFFLVFLLFGHAWSELQADKQKLSDHYKESADYWRKRYMDAVGLKDEEPWD